jgi:fructokinase
MAREAPLLVVGEALVDLMPGAPGAAGTGQLALRAVPGGGPANTAVGLARLGLPVSFAGRFSLTGLGSWRRQRLADERVDLASSVSSHRPQTMAVVSVAAQGGATYDFYGPETADWWWEEAELPPVRSLAGGIVHTGSLATAIDPGATVLAAWARRLRQSGEVVVSYDPNVRPTLLGSAERCRRRAEPFLAAAHLVKVSREDLDVLAPGAGDREARRWLEADPGPTLVVVTAGPAGASAFHRDGRTWHRPAQPVEVVDTVGAGDAFAAGLLASLWWSGRLTPAALRAIDDEAVVSAVDVAIRTGAMTCGREGADPPRFDELGEGFSLSPTVPTGQG